MTEIVKKFTNLFIIINNDNQSAPLNTKKILSIVNIQKANNYFIKRVIKNGLFSKSIKIDIIDQISQLNWEISPPLPSDLSRNLTMEAISIINELTQILNDFPIFKYLKIFPNFLLPQR